MNCPNCSVTMSVEVLQSHLHLPLSIDVCWPCRLIWFDHMESTQLAPGSVIALFKAIHEKRDLPNAIISLRLPCPRCASTLKLTQDIQRGGKFSYHRCQNNDGRLSSFFQFLREKNFVRNLNAAEINQLSASVKQVRCSSCGGSIDLTHDVACGHCGSALAALDEDAVNKALSGLSISEKIRTTINPDKMGDALMQRPIKTKAYSYSRVEDDPLSAHVSEVLVDLVASGISRLISRFGR